MRSKRRKECIAAALCLSQPLSLTSFDSSPAGAPFGVLYKHGVQSRTPSRSDRFKGVTGVARGPKGRNRNLPWPPCKKGYKDAYLLFIFLTPQSIAKPSPGWNKVALLTAVRNSPCSCPFSVSLTRPQDALNSEPRFTVAPFGAQRITSKYTTKKHLH